MGYAYAQNETHALVFLHHMHHYALRADSGVDTNQGFLNNQNKQRTLSH